MPREPLYARLASQSHIRQADTGHQFFKPKGKVPSWYKKMQTRQASPAYKASGGYAHPDVHSHVALEVGAKADFAHNQGYGYLAHKYHIDAARLHGQAAKASTNSVQTKYHQKESIRHKLLARRLKTAGLTRRGVPHLPGPGQHHGSDGRFE